MFLIRGVGFSTCFFPYRRVYLGEEGVRLFRGVLDVGDVEGIGQRKGFLIYAGSADDEHFFFGLASGQGCFQRGIALRSRELDVLTAQDDVAAVGQGTLRQGLEGAASHDDGVAGGERLEAFQIVGQPIQQFVLKAYRTVTGDGYNDGNIHNSQSLGTKIVLFLKTERILHPPSQGGERIRKKH